MLSRYAFFSGLKPYMSPKAEPEDVPDPIRRRNSSALFDSTPAPTTPTPTTDVPSPPTPAPTTAAPTHAPTLSQARIRFVVGDPSSYLYLDSRRPAEECLALANTGTSHSCKSFSASNTALKDCSGYNDYKYGLNLDDLEANSYVKPFKESANQLDKLRSAFPKQDLRFMLGDQDYCNCNTENFENSKHCYPLRNREDPLGVLFKNYSQGKHHRTEAPTFPPALVCLPDKHGGHGCCDTWPDAFDHNAMDTKCGGMVQGTNRLQRGINFLDYLKDYYGGSSYFNYDFFTGGHDFPSMVQHPTFQRWAFKKKD